jgi:hypothetical protein
MIIGCPNGLGLASVLDGVTASQEMCGQIVTSGQTKKDLSYLDWIARLVAPVTHARRLRLLLSENGY